ncbi:MAG: SDR family oxidoreductase [Spirochaetaceae bacterium]|nr:SDR family oxidoreductase [Myxococcales bacterium]MCB9725138.1 SDR family oxidoreductase [Spirochaetaceae bacterium]
MSLDARAGLRGRRIWVVGAGGGGIGTSVARELAAVGADVLAIDRDGPALEPTLAPLEAGAGALRGRVVDATERAPMEALFRDEIAAGRPPDGLVDIVGGLARDRFGSIVETTDETFDAVMTLNLRAAWLASQLFARHAIESRRPGRIVQLASIAALQAMPFGAAYAAAKAALLSLMRTQALEWGRHGIRVNAIAAGTIHVPRSPSVDAERDRRVLPLGRRGRPADIAGAALFLLSDLADFVTGQVIAVDGGASIKPSYVDETGLPVFVDDAGMRARLLGADER